MNAAALRASRLALPGGDGNRSFSYTHVLRSREFETQENNDGFGALIVSLKL